VRSGLAVVALAMAIAGCRKTEPPPARSTPDAAPVPAEPAYTRFETSNGMSISVPDGTTKIADAGGAEMVLLLPSGATVTLDAFPTCGRKFSKICTGTLRGDLCEAPGERMRMADDVVFTLTFKGAVPPRVLSSWSVPSKLPEGVGYYCSTDQNIRNMAED
jgi:hypothetical protein